jgi:hypothetical protein
MIILDDSLFVFHTITYADKYKRNYTQNDLLILLVKLRLLTSVWALRLQLRLSHFASQSLSFGNRRRLRAFAILLSATITPSNYLVAPTWVLHYQHIIIIIVLWYDSFDIFVNLRNHVWNNQTCECIISESVSDQAHIIAINR